MLIVVTEADDLAGQALSRTHRSIGRSACIPWTVGVGAVRECSAHVGKCLRSSALAPGGAQPSEDLGQQSSRRGSRSHWEPSWDPGRPCMCCFGLGVRSAMTETFVSVDAWQPHEGKPFALRDAARHSSETQVATRVPQTARQRRAVCAFGFLWPRRPVAVPENTAVSDSPASCRRPYI